MTPGQYKTQELITRNYWWPYIQADICKYIDRCETCQRTKTHREKPHNPLQPNEIPLKPREHISVDIIGELPESNRYNTILVTTDRLSKMIIAILTNMDLTAYGAAIGLNTGILRVGFSHTIPEPTHTVTRHGYTHTRTVIRAVLCGTFGTRCHTMKWFHSRM